MPNSLAPCHRVRWSLHGYDIAMDFQTHNLIVEIYDTVDVSVAHKAATVRSGCEPVFYIVKQNAEINEWFIWIKY